MPRTGEGPLADVIAAFAWLALLAVFAPNTKAAKAKTASALISGALVGAVWMIAPAAYPLLALALVTFAGSAAIVEPRSERRPLLAFAGVAVLPAMVACVLWTIGDDQTRETLRYDWAAPALSFASISVAARITAVFAAIYLGLALRRPQRPRWPSLAMLAIVLVALKVVMRAAWIGTTIVLPEDAGWSESGAMSNLLKLRTGAPLFAPFTECSSYSYAPTLEIVHHALLSPFGLDLSLVANRVLALGWQLATGAILARILTPFFASRGARIVVWLVAILVATSSFLAPHLHPDHVLMPSFALALGLALHETRLRPRTVIAGLVLLPAIAAAAKLTGAGIGLGLAFAFGLPLRRRMIGGLAGGALASVLVLVVYERAHPGFWRHTFALQASHWLRWRELTTIVTEPAGRLFLIALAMLGVLAWLSGDDGRDARREVVRVLLVSLGFALPSTIAYLKIGGRTNSLLPLAIGASVACARMLAFLVQRARAEQSSSMPAFAAAAACVLAYLVAPVEEIIPRALRDAVRERHARMIAYVRDETAAGRRPLLPQSTAAWIEAGRTDVPRDRWQTMSELAIGDHPELRVCQDRVVSSTYESIIVDRAYFDRDRSPATASLAPAFERDYDLVEDRPIAGGLVPSIRLYRRKPAP